MYQFSEEVRKAYEALPFPMVIDQLIDGKVVPLLASDGFCRLTGMERGKVLEWFSDSQFERIHPDDVGNVTIASELFAKRERDYNVLFRGRHSDGYHYIHAVGHWLDLPEGTALAAIVYTDVNESGQKIRALSEQYNLFREDAFFTDPCTKLPNLNYLHKFADDKVNSIRVDGEVPALIYLDMNSMQSYNNQYGFAEGDQLLRLVASVLTETFPRALVTRGAEDHFMVVTPMESREEIAGKIMAANQRIKKEAYGNTTGVQTGICIYDEDMLTVEAVDHAKHAVKRMGTNLDKVYRFFRAEADNLYWQQRYIVENFDKALENGWFKVYYQAVASVTAERPVFLEALARWVDPVRGIISPGEFIPVLEKYHLLHRMDLFIFEEVCREISIRSKSGLDLLPVSVNFARQDFDHVDVAEALVRIVRESGVAELGLTNSDFIIEITEQDMAQATDHFYGQLREIRENGFKLWLDDFGSGYSSLNVFSKFDVDLIKFDMDLLKNLDGHRGANREILRSMVAVSKKLGIHTLAEGMETETQRDFLKEIGCEYMQGFGFHRPEPLQAALFRRGIFK